MVLFYSKVRQVAFIGCWSHYYFIYYKRLFNSSVVESSLLAGHVYEWLRQDRTRTFTRRNSVQGLRLNGKKLKCSKMLKLIKIKQHP